MGDRVPSFFTSPSLVNFGGLSVTDGIHVEGLSDQYRQDSEDIPSRMDHTLPTIVHTRGSESHMPPIPTPDINPGWGGMGLRGNRNSGGHLERTLSDASGLFIDDDHPIQQVPGEQTNHAPASSVPHRPASASSLEEPSYIKTSNMANFYYRNFTSHQSLDKMGRSLSHVDNRSDSKPAAHTRRKSQSHTQLNFGSFIAMPPSQEKQDKTVF
jgi:hypothetical protein